MKDQNKLQLLLYKSHENQQAFGALDTKGVGEDSNARYMVHQLDDYLASIRIGMEHEDDEVTQRMMKVHAMTELSRVAALLLRECARQGWDFLRVLADGVEYESYVLTSIAAGTRAPRPAFLDRQKEGAA